MKLLIIGTGYVGLVSGTCFAEMGHTVICLDIDKEKIALLQEGIIPIYEPGLKEMVTRNIKEGRLFFTTSYEEALSECDVCFLCLPTPEGEDGSCDTSYVLQAAETIASHMKGYKLIVNKSTVPVGTATKVKECIRSKTACDFDVVSNPEFLKEGSAVADCMKPDRIIIGSDSERATNLMRKIYASFTLNHDRIQIMDILSAELTKYAANAMLATRISFMNELSRLSEAVGADINAIRKGIGSDHRIGHHFLYAGAGYGGSCFPKDIKALIATFHDHNLEAPLLEAVETVNARQKRVLALKIRNYFSDLQGKEIAVWGLSFKPETDDMREAPSLTLLKELLATGARLRVYDPIAMDNAKRLLGEETQLRWCTSEYEAAEGADAIALLTEWKQFRFANLERVSKSMRGKAFFDGRNQYSNSEMKEMGFDYFSIGRQCDLKEQ